jgi:16S rRNA (cytosine967-C5)-methyltransferase
MVRKVSRRPAAFGGKPPRKAHPSGSRERVFRGQPGSAPSDGPGRRAGKSGGKASGPGPGTRARQAGTPRPGPNQVKSLPAVANLTASVAPAVLRAVFDSGAWLEPAVAKAFGTRPDVRRTDRHLVLRSMAALCRWWGWIEPLHLLQVEDQLLLATLLDCHEVDGICRTWASKTGRPFDRLMAVGDAPGWTARAEGLKRWVGGGPVTADPWLLFPTWLRDQLPLPPGDTPAKARRLAFLYALQTRLPLWVGVRGGAEKAIWNELREAGLKPWIHRRLTTAARFDLDTDLSSLRASREGDLVIDDLSSQALGKVCDPDPGERWWDAIGGTGLHALHLGALMQNKGTVVTTFEHDKRRHETAIRLRRFPFRNIAAKLWDSRRTPGKPGSFDGVLVDAPCSAVGSWRRHPELRWIVKKEDLPRLVEHQKQLLDAASAAVRPGGTLIYSVATATVIETLDLITAFLGSHPEFCLDPFPHPLEESTTSGTLQLWPHLHDCEARFIARMVRKTSPS